MISQTYRLNSCSASQVEYFLEYDDRPLHFINWSLLLFTLLLKTETVTVQFFVFYVWMIKLLPKPLHRWSVIISLLNFISLWAITDSSLDVNRWTEHCTQHGMVDMKIVLFRCDKKTSGLVLRQVMIDIFWLFCFPRITLGTLLWVRTLAIS